MEHIYYPTQKPQNIYYNLLSVHNPPDNNINLSGLAYSLK